MHPGRIVAIVAVSLIAAAVALFTAVSLSLLATDDPEFNGETGGPLAVTGVMLYALYVAVWWIIKLATRGPRQGPRGWGFEWGYQWWRLHAIFHVMIGVSIGIFVSGFSPTMERGMWLGGFLLATGLATFLAVMVYRYRSGLVGPAAELVRAAQGTKKGLEGQLSLDELPEAEAALKRWKIIQWTALIPLLVMVRGLRPFLRNGTIGATGAAFIVVLSFMALTIFIVARWRLTKATRVVATLSLQEIVTEGEKIEARQTAQPPAATSPREQMAPTVRLVVGVKRDPSGLPAAPVTGREASPTGRTTAGLGAYRSGDGQGAVYGKQIKAAAFDEGPPVMEKIPAAYLKQAFEEASTALRSAGVEQAPGLYFVYQEDF